MKRHTGGPQGNKTTFTLPKKLTRAEATKKTIHKVGGNFRALTYDPKTGRTTVI